MRFLFPVEKGGRRNRIHLHVLFRPRIHQCNELVGILEWHRMQQESFGHAEHRGVRADAETQRDHANQRCQAMLQKHADAEAYVLPDSDHGDSCRVVWCRVVLRELLLCDRRRGTLCLAIRLRSIGADARFLRLFDDTAVEQVNGALGEVGVALVVGDHADRSAVAV